MEQEINDFSSLQLLKEFFAVKAVKFIKNLDGQDFEENNGVNLTKLPPWKVDPVHDEKEFLDDDQGLANNIVVSVSGLV